MDLLVKKAWDLYRHTERLPVETIHTATIWLEEKHAKAPGEKIAMAIALHYLILALRYDPSMESAIAQDTAGARSAGRSRPASRARFLCRQR
jgi:hypothetical protein